MNIDKVVGGSTPKWGLTIRDEAGQIIDPSDTNKVDKVHIEIFDKGTKEILMRFAYPAENGEIGSITFTGSGLNDMSNTGTYTGAGVKKKYRVEIGSVGTPNKFRWSDTGGASWNATGVSITGDWQVLNNGVEIKFNATEGHTLNDRWDFECLGWTTAIVENNEQVTFVISSEVSDGADKGEEYGVVVEAHLKVAAGQGYPNDIDIVIKRGTLVSFEEKMG